MPILEARKLNKVFGGFSAVKDISLSLKEGEILGLLGPNGAGKTTTIQMLLGVLTPTSGDVFYFGKKLLQRKSEVLDQVNFSSTYTNLPWDLTVWENLNFVSYLYTIDNRRQRVKKVMEMFRLEDLAKQRISELSAGQVTRVNLAKAFINFPKILLLDEPTASLDPDIASYIRELILEQQSEYGVSMVFTSHNMAEVEEVCDRVIFINHGKIIANDTPDSLAKTIEFCHIDLLPKDQKAMAEFCRDRSFKFIKQGRHLIIDVREKELPGFLNDVALAKLEYQEISIDKPSLEDYFLQNSNKL